MRHLSMDYRFLLFDLDGTLSDPKEGITRCINYALTAHDFSPLPTDALLQCIGPPLDYSFRQLTEKHDAELIASLVSKYRERYADVGYRENTLYPGIAPQLDQLYSSGRFTLGVCTSKRVDFAEQILQLFELHGYFDFVSGGDVGMAKGTQIKTLLADGRIGKDTLMIGDRSFDLVAANDNQIAAAGVLWGYGSKEELMAHHPEILFEAPADMGSLLK